MTSVRSGLASEVDSSAISNLDSLWAGAGSDMLNRRKIIPANDCIDHNTPPRRGNNWMSISTAAEEMEMLSLHHSSGLAVDHLP